MRPDILALFAKSNDVHNEFLAKNIFDPLFFFNILFSLVLPISVI